MGRRSRDKGARRERAIAELHMACGLRAERVPLSGAAHYRGNSADVDLYVRGGTPVRAEIKARGDGDGFRTLERWLGTNDALFLWRDRAAAYEARVRELEAAAAPTTAPSAPHATGGSDLGAPEA